MPYTYPNAEALDGQPKVGSKQCVALVKHYAGAPASSLWKEGAKVRGCLGLATGTVIATFVDGRYPNASTGNHAALYLSQDAGGIWVMDQWASDDTKPTISKRYISFRGSQSATRASNNADRYSVVE